MKYIIVALSMFAAGTFAIEYRVISIPYSGLNFSQYVPLVIPEGQTVEFIAMHTELTEGTSTPSGSLSISYGDHEKKLNLSSTTDGKILEGPVTMWPRVETEYISPGGGSYGTYEGSVYFIFKIKDSFDVNLKPMNIISLPEDNNGDMNLVIETSTDLQTWTPVFSGSAGTSGSAAFFRTRLIQ